jgi:hypothetical protein
MKKSKQQETIQQEQPEVEIKLVKIPENEWQKYLIAQAKLISIEFYIFNETTCSCAYFPSTNNLIIKSLNKIDFQKTIKEYQSQTNEKYGNLIYGERLIDLFKTSQNLNEHGEYIGELFAPYLNARGQVNYKPLSYLNISIKQFTNLLPAQFIDLVTLCKQGTEVYVTELDQTHSPITSDQAKEALVLIRYKIILEYENNKSSKTIQKLITMMNKNELTLSSIKEVLGGKSKKTKKPIYTMLLELADIGLNIMNQEQLPEKIVLTKKTNPISTKQTIPLKHPISHSPKPKSETTFLENRFSAYIAQLYKLNTLTTILVGSFSAYIAQLYKINTLKGEYGPKLLRLYEENSTQFKKHFYEKIDKTIPDGQLKKILAYEFELFFETYKKSETRAPYTNLIKCINTNLNSDHIENPLSKIDVYVIPKLIKLAEEKYSICKNRKEENKSFATLSGFYEINVEILTHIILAESALTAEKINTSLIQAKEAGEILKELYLFLQGRHIKSTEAQLEEKCASLECIGLPSFLSNDFYGFIGKKFIGKKNATSLSVESLMEEIKIFYEKYMLNLKQTFNI